MMMLEYYNKEGKIVKGMCGEGDWFMYDNGYCIIYSIEDPEHIYMKDVYPGEDEDTWEYDKCKYPVTRSDIKKMTKIS